MFNEWKLVVFVLYFVYKYGGVIVYVSEVVWIFDCRYEFFLGFNF